MRIILVLILLTSCSNLQRDLTIDHFKHFYVAPRGSGLKPALLLVPDCFGLTDYFKERANRLADQGFHVLALDLNGEGKTTHLPGESREFCEKQSEPLNILKTALSELRKLDGVDKQNVGALGYTKGADLIFGLARNGAEFKAMALVQGGLASQLHKSPFTEVKVLVLNGALDPTVNSKIIGLFKKELKLNQLTYEFLNFPGARMGFYKPASTKLGDDFDLPFAYDKESDKSSFKKINIFLKNTLR
jgi:dienelactone hydrolase